MRKSIKSSITNSDAVSVDTIKETGGLSEIRQTPEPAPLSDKLATRRRRRPKLGSALLEGLVEALLDSILP